MSGCCVYFHCFRSAADVEENLYISFKQLLLRLLPFLRHREPEDYLFGEDIPQIITLSHWADQGLGCRGTVCALDSI
eukprot:1164330-Amphidinium_carterae.1